MFLEIEDLGTAMYGYQIDEITQGDESIVIEAIKTAITEVKGFLKLYDVAAIFAATGAERDPLILSYTKTVTKWYLVELCNAEMIYEQVKERYDRAIARLRELLKGDVTIDGLPPAIEETTIDAPGLTFGSRTKFTHE